MFFLFHVPDPCVNKTKPNPFWLYEHLSKIGRERGMERGKWNHLKFNGQPPEVRAPLLRTIYHHHHRHVPTGQKVLCSCHKRVGLLSPFTQSDSQTKVFCC